MSIAYHIKLAEQEARECEKYKNYDKKSYQYFYHVVFRIRTYCTIHNTVELSFLENNERINIIFDNSRSCQKYIEGMYNDYRKKVIRDELIHIKHATQDDYLDVQQELMEQGNKIIGVDVIYTTPPNPYVYVIKYQKDTEIT